MTICQPLCPVWFWSADLFCDRRTLFAPFRLCDVGRASSSFFLVCSSELSSNTQRNSHMLRLKCHTTYKVPRICWPVRLFLFAMQWSALRPPNPPLKFFTDKFHHCVVFLGHPHSSNTTNYLKTPTRVHVQVICCGIFHSSFDFLLFAKEKILLSPRYSDSIDWLIEFHWIYVLLKFVAQHGAHHLKENIIHCHWQNCLKILHVEYHRFFIPFSFFFIFFIFLFFFFHFFNFFFIFLLFFSFFFYFFSVGKIRTDSQKAPKKWTDSWLLY